VIFAVEAPVRTTVPTCGRPRMTQGTPWNWPI